MSAAKEGAAKILLTVTEVVEHSVAVAEEVRARRRREEAAQNVIATAKFAELLAEVLDIDGFALERPSLEFEVGGRRFLVSPHGQGWNGPSLSVAQLCSEGCGRPARDYADAWVTDHESLGAYIVMHAEPVACRDCRHAATPEPTLAERLEAVIREVVQDVIANREAGL